MNAENTPNSDTKTVEDLKKKRLPWPADEFIFWPLIRPTSIFIYFLLIWVYLDERSIYSLKSDLSKLQEEFLTLEENYDEAKLQLSKYINNNGISSSKNLLSFSWSDLNPGLYLLEREITLKNVKTTGTYNANYIIFHFAYPLQVNGTNYNTQIGFASAGILKSPQIYVDFDNDSKVDASMIYEVASLVPLSGLIIKNISEENSQKVYDKVRENIKDSSFTSFNDLKKSGQGIGFELYSALADSSSNMAKLIEEYIK